MTIPPPVRGAGVPRGQKGRLKLNTSSGTDLGDVPEKWGGSTYITLSDLIGSTNTTFSVLLIASPVPFNLVITVRDDSGGFPGPETTTTYAMGPSNATQSITLTGDETITDARASRRF